MTRLLVFAYSGVGYDALTTLIQRNETIVGVVTHQDAPQEHIWFPSIVDLAKANNIAVFTPEHPNNPEFIAHIATLNPELIFSFYYRQMISEEILNLAPKGAFNIHGSLLPKYRGRCPVNWVLIHGEKESGATLHHMVAKADAGDIVDQEAFPIGDDDTAGDVMDNVRRVSIAILQRQLQNLKAGTAPRYSQDLSQGRYFGGRSSKDNWIDWNQTASDIHNLIRSQLPYPQYPGAFAKLNGKNVRILGSRVYQKDISISQEPGTTLSPSPLRVNCQNSVLEILNMQDI